MNTKKKEKKNKNKKLKSNVNVNEEFSCELGRDVNLIQKEKKWKTVAVTKKRNASFTRSSLKKAALLCYTDVGHKLTFVDKLINKN